MAKKKFKESEKVLVKRSEINFAPFNPKSHSEDSIKEMRANVKRVGLFGGIIWNKTTGNLIDGHKRVMTTDLIQGYDGTDATDYEIGVEIAELDLKAEKEQNIWQTKSRTELDNELLRELIPDIDYKFAGLTDFEVELIMPDIESYEIYTPETESWNKEEVITEDLQEIDESTKQAPENTKIDRSVNFYEDTPENQIARHNEIKKVKDRIKNQNDEDKDFGALSYVVVRFENYKNKESFMIRMGYDKYEKMIDGEEFSQNIERID